LAPKIALTTPDWYGSLSVAYRDDTGNLYRRNRYYDPTQGQFTQTDPIGIAGGMNLLGFAGGDPINSSDPFGLCIDKGDPFCQWFQAAFAFALGNLREEVSNIVDALGTLTEDGCPECTKGVVPDVVPGGAGAARTTTRLIDAARELAERIGRHRVFIRTPSGGHAIDLVGRPHGGVPTPHVRLFQLHRNPVTGQARLQGGPAQAATAQDIRNARNYFMRLFGNR
jgi:RHS repeat-associated protein